MKTLLIIAHPNYAESKANRALTALIADNENVSVHDIASVYADGKIDIEAELQLAEAHDRIVFQFPTHWFNVPAVLKNWIDQVIAGGWAGEGKHRLNGKPMGLVTTSGITADVYSHDKFGYTIDELMIPMKASIQYVKGEFLGLVHLGGVPFLGTPSTEDIENIATNYRQLVLGA